MIYAMRGEHAKAEAILRKVLQVFPDYPLARNNLGIAYLARAKRKKLKLCLRRLATQRRQRRRYPQTWDAARNLARLRHKEKTMSQRSQSGESAS